MIMVLGSPRLPPQSYRRLARPFRPRGTTWSMKPAAKCLFRTQFRWLAKKCPGLGGSSQNFHSRQGGIASFACFLRVGFTGPNCTMVL